MSLTPVHSTVRAGDLDVAITRAGDGEDVVLVHGGFADRSMWQNTLPVFAGTHRVTSYDLRGHGDTGPSGYGVYSPELFGKDLLALMDALGIERAHVVGLSLGGVVAQNAAVLAPERVNRLVLASTMVRHDLTKTDRVMTYFPFISPSLTLRAVGPIPFARLSLGLIRAWRGKGWMSKDPETRDRLIAMAKRLTRDEYVKTLQAIYRNPGVALEDITAPTLVMTGELETEVLTTHAKTFETRIPDARRVTVPGAGHMINLDAPDAFERKVLGFLSSAD